MAAKSSERTALVAPSDADYLTLGVDNAPQQKSEGAWNTKSKILLAALFLSTIVLGIVFGLGLSHSSNVAPLNSSPRERFDAFADYVRNMDHMGNTSKVKGKMPSTESGEMMKSKLKSKAKDAWNNYTENGTLPELPTALPTLPERGHWGSKFGRNETGSGRNETGSGRNQTEGGDIGDNETESGGRRGKHAKYEEIVDRIKKKGKGYYSD